MTRQFYAMKVLNKQRVLQKEQVRLHQYQLAAMTCHLRAATDCGNKMPTAIAAAAWQHVAALAKCTRQRRQACCVGEVYTSASSGLLCWSRS